MLYARAAVGADRPSMRGNSQPLIFTFFSSSEVALGMTRLLRVPVN
jgi:hypothetical protein